MSSGPPKYGEGVQTIPSSQSLTIHMCTYIFIISVKFPLVFLVVTALDGADGDTIGQFLKKELKTN